MRTKRRCGNGNLRWATHAVNEQIDDVVLRKIALAEVLVLLPKLLGDLAHRRPRQKPPAPLVGERILDPARLQALDEGLGAIVPVPCGEETLDMIQHESVVIRLGESGSLLADVASLFGRCRGCSGENNLGVGQMRPHPTCESEAARLPGLDLGEDNVDPP